MRVPIPPAYVGHAFYRFCAFINPSALRTGWDRDRIRQAIADCGVPCFKGVTSEIYLENAFAEMRPPKRLPIAGNLSQTCLTFLVHPTLSGEHILKTARSVRKVMTMASR
jgi:dTDP-4-amino-4,6-dideoxygalactose transaminase